MLKKSAERLKVISRLPKTLLLILRELGRRLKMLLLAKKRMPVDYSANWKMNSLLLLKFRSPSRNSREELKRWKKNLKLNVRPEQRLNVRDLTLPESLKALVKD